MTLPPSGRIVSLNDEPPTGPLYDGDRGDWPVAAAAPTRTSHRPGAASADCLVESGVREFDELRQPGPTWPPEVMPLNFGDAPGGWLIAHMNGDQELAVFFYDSATRQNAPRTRRPTSRMPWR